MLKGQCKEIFEYGFDFAERHAHWAGAKSSVVSLTTAESDSAMALTPRSQTPWYHWRPLSQTPRWHYHHRVGLSSAHVIYLLVLLSKHKSYFFSKVFLSIKENFTKNVHPIFSWFKFILGFIIHELKYLYVLAQGFQDIFHGDFVNFV